MRGGDKRKKRGGNEVWSFILVVRHPTEGELGASFMKLLEDEFVSFADVILFYANGKSRATVEYST